MQILDKRGAKESELEKRRGGEDENGTELEFHDDSASQKVGLIDDADI